MHGGATYDLDSGKNMKHLRNILLLIILIILLIPTSVSALTDNWTIEGNKVYVDDANVYLSATPAVLGSSGWVEFELKSKKYEGAIDVAWGFDSGAGVKASKPQIWAENVPHTKYRLVDVEKVGSLHVDNITSFIKLNWTTFVGQPDIGNRNNTYLYRVTANFGEVEQTLVIAFNSYKKVGSVADITYNYNTQEQESYIEYYPDWKPNANFNKIAYDHQGYDDWSLVSLDASIQKNVIYKVRCWIEIPFSGLNPSQGEYLWAVKPLGETVDEAKNNGHLYILDPWWDSQWAFRKKLTFDNSASSENLTNFAVRVSLNSTRIDYAFTQNLGQDIRFVDADNTTVLDYEIENWDETGTSSVWVEVPQIDAGSTTDYIWMYYGNSLAADGQNVAGVWETSAVLVAHSYDNPNTSTIQDSTSYNNDGNKKGAGEPLEANGKIYKGQDFDGADDSINCGSDAELDGLAPATWLAWIKPDTLGENSAGRIFHKQTVTGDTSGTIPLGMSATNTITFTVDYDGTDLRRTSSNNKITMGSLQLVAATWTGAIGSSTVHLYVNGVETTYQTSTAATGNRISDAAYNQMIGNTPLGARTFDGIIDEARIYNEVKSLEWLEATYLTQKDAFITYGSVEYNPPTVVTNATLNVEETTATLSGNITSIGSANATLRGFQYDTDGTPYTTNWTEVCNSGVGNFTHDLIGLTEGELYYYIAQAYNIGGGGYGSEVTFITKPDEPSGFTAVGYNTQNNLSWTNGAGADNTTIRGKIGSYPADQFSDVLVYNGIGTSANHTGLTNGDHWYYRAWSWCTEGGLEQWSDTYDEADATPHTIPTVVTNPAFNIEETVATLSGNITSTGGENCTMVGFQYDTDGTPYTTNWTDVIGNYGVGNFIYSPVLTEGELYYYIAQAYNTAGWDYGAEETFLTKPDEPIGFTATGRHQQVNLSWVLGAGADNTTIYGRLGTYPISRVDPLATLVYNGTLTSANHTGLTNGDHWYYRAWSYCTEGGLYQWSDLYAEADATPDLFPPTNFTLIDMGSSTVNITWTKAIDADNTVIRVSRTAYPISITDGEFVYFGTGTVQFDVGVALDITTYYYRAWSENGGVYSTDYAEGQIGGTGMIFLGLLAFAGIMSFIGARNSFWIFKFLAGCVWAIVGMYWINSPQGGVVHGSSVDTGIIILFFFIGIAFGLSAFWTGKFSNGQETGGRFRLPFMQTDEEEELARQQRNMASWHQGADVYTAKLNAALRGERRRR